ncbi:hypothetical protein PK28_01020 [Hymenobacter sp. DG25B]|nr:hypothetical protein PK28_01020 [Hymenobacter sp. DG25B]
MPLLNGIINLPSAILPHRHIIHVVIRIIRLLLKLHVHLLVSGPAAASNVSRFARRIVVLV